MKCRLFFLTRKLFFETYMLIKDSYTYHKILFKLKDVIFKKRTGREKRTKVQKYLRILSPNEMFQ